MGELTRLERHQQVFGPVEQLLAFLRDDARFERFLQCGEVESWRFEIEVERLAEKMSI